MVELDGTVATVGFGAPEVPCKDAGAEFAVSAAAASFSHGCMLPYRTTCPAAAIG
jgi:hypothetical protein